MKQKMVIRVQMTCDKCRSKAMGLVASVHGVERVEIQGDDRDQLAVVGDGVDAANLTACLRKKIGNADLLTLLDEPVDETMNRLGALKDILMDGLATCYPYSAERD
ncbi:hypothetical protein VPH35_038091 [Triticum aestivum]|uniref:HMA domain-containing protein n=1 Tax=Aegilops tauschii TaxID=37682 RepID=M8BBM0_AEGTA